jgi:hypothetical protein
MGEDEKRQLQDAARALDGAEREVVAAMQNFIDAQVKTGRSRDHALDILRQLLKRAREEKARKRRANFRVVE